MVKSGLQKDKMSLSDAEQWQVCAGWVGGWLGGWVGVGVGVLHICIIYIYYIYIMSTYTQHSTHFTCHHKSANIFVGAGLLADNHIVCFFSLTTHVTSSTKLQISTPDYITTIQILTPDYQYKSANTDPQKY
jgi:hypothetical protein